MATLRYNLHKTGYSFKPKTSLDRRLYAFEKGLMHAERLFLDEMRSKKKSQRGITAATIRPEKSRHHPVRFEVMATAKLGVPGLKKQRTI